MSWLFVVGAVLIGSSSLSAAPVTLPHSECPSPADLAAALNAGNHAPGQTWAQAGTTVVHDCKQEFTAKVYDPGVLTITNVKIDADNCSPTCGQTNGTPSPKEFSTTEKFSFTEKTTTEHTISLEGKVEWGAGKLLSLIAAAKVEIKAGWQGKWGSETSRTYDIDFTMKFTVDGCKWERVQRAAAVCTGKKGSVHINRWVVYNVYCHVHKVVYQNQQSSLSGTVTMNTQFQEGALCSKVLGAGVCPPNNPEKPAWLTDAQLLTGCGWSATP
jgi:hypothetical protein